MFIISSIGEAKTLLSETPLDLEAFVALVNSLLPRFLPSETQDEKALVSARLVRYFSTQGLLDEPFKIGREARYGERHLLQLLAIRRLMANGYSTNLLKNLLLGLDDEALQRLIEGQDEPRVQLSQPIQEQQPPAENAALQWLQSVRARERIAPLVPPPAPSPPAPVVAPPAPVVSQWTHIEIAPGLEVEMRDDFSLPRSPHEWQILLERLQKLLQASRPTFPSSPIRRKK